MVLLLAGCRLAVFVVVVGSSRRLRSQSFATIDGCRPPDPRIEKQMSKLGHLRRRRRRKSRKTRRRKLKGAPSKMPHRDPCGNLAKSEHSDNLTNTDNSEGFVPPTGRSWTRPGWCLGAAPLHPAPRGRRAGRPAGPGLPNVDETGDDD